MQNSEYVKTMKLAASSRMAARRDQRRKLGFDLHEGMSERAFSADSLHTIRQLHTLARLLTRCVMTKLEWWWLSRIIVLWTALIVTASRASMQCLSLAASQLNWRPRRIRPNVNSGVEPGQPLSR